MSRAVIVASVLDDAPWPLGTTAWWRNELECPECAADGTVSLMGARRVDGVIVDHCPAHGAWFDRGEIARLMGSPGDDLEMLRGRIEIATPSTGAQAAHRARWREQQDLRKKAAEAYRAASAIQIERERETAAAATAELAEATRLLQRKHQEEQDLLARQEATIAAKELRRREAETVLQRELARLRTARDDAARNLALAERDLEVQRAHAREAMSRIGLAEMSVSKARATLAAITEQLRITNERTGA